MRPSEDDVLAPRTFRSSRRRSFGLLALGVVMVVAGAAMLAADAPWGWAVLAFGVVSVPVFVLLLVRPNRLELTAEGFTTVTLGRRWSVAWKDCGEFRVTSNSLNLGAPAMVVFDCRAPGVRGHVLETTAEVLAGANAGLPETYGMRPSDLASILNTYRRASAEAR